MPVDHLDKTLIYDRPKCDVVQKVNIFLLGIWHFVKFIIILYIIKNVGAFCLAPLDKFGLNSHT